MNAFSALLVVGLMLAASSNTSAAGDRVILRGDMGFDPIRLKDLERASQVELNGASFRVGISRNPSPNAEHDCDQGGQPVNRYPFALERSPKATVDGGLFSGIIPLQSDWIHTYCNSAAVRVEASPEATVRETRMRRVWDGIRIDQGTQDFRIARVWMSDVRDDCVENDYLMSGRVRDSLFDGCFAGFSVAPTKSLNRVAAVRFDRILMRMQSFVYRGKLRHALPFKMKSDTARITLNESVIAFEAQNLVGGKHIEKMWRSIVRCRNNKLLWLGPGNPPSYLDAAPQCFQVLTGEAARRAWFDERTAWISENPGVARFGGE